MLRPNPAFSRASGEGPYRQVRLALPHPIRKIRSESVEIKGIRARDLLTIELVPADSAKDPVIHAFEVLEEAPDA